MISSSINSIEPREPSFIATLLKPARRNARMISFGSIAFVISKYSPGSPAKPNVEHRFYTTVNIVHTMEALLGLPPMNQNDAYAPVMSGLFTGAGDQPPYVADYRNSKNELIYETNKREAPGSKISSRMDFSRPDAAGAARLNRVLWQDQHGNTPMPAPKHSVFPEGGD